MEDRVYLINLYDFYGELLTDKQQLYFEDYYFNNLTHQEIGENSKITRNAVHKQLKDVIEKLNHYEEKLNLYKKSIQINKLINKISDEKIKEELKNLM